MATSDFLSRYPIISDQVEKGELAVILEQLEAALEGTTSGDVVELGCFIGTTSLFIRRLLNERSEPRNFHVYDSFAGLPEKTDKDSSPAGEQFRVGELLATKKQLLLNFKKANLRPPIVHKGWFSELTVDEMPTEIAFAFLDGDYFASINDSLRVVWPKLVPGAVIVVDDYANEALPGARQAVDEWLQTHPAQLRTEQSLAVITPHH